MNRELGNPLERVLHLFLSIKALSCYSTLDFTGIATLSIALCREIGFCMLGAHRLREEKSLNSIASH